MLKCGHCGYELTWLVKGPEAVVCPECGGRMEHLEGRASAGAWRSLRPWRWRAILIPCGLVLLANVIGLTVSLLSNRQAPGREVALLAVLLGPLAAAIIGFEMMKRLRRPEHVDEVHWFGAKTLTVFIATFLAGVTAIGILWLLMATLPRIYELTT